MKAKSLKKSYEANFFLKKVKKKATFYEVTIKYKLRLLSLNSRFSNHI